MLFQSLGGQVADGVCLYRYFQSLPIDLTIYNMGSVQSIAVVAYLGAKHRVVNESATFMLHRTSNAALGGMATAFQAAAKSLTIDDQRTEAILRERIRLTDSHWDEINKFALTLSAKESVELGIADTIWKVGCECGLC